MDKISQMSKQGLSSERQEWPREVQRFENAIYLYGLDKLDRDEIWNYFAQFEPTQIDMLNKSAGLVFFETSNNCKSAITNTGKPILEQDTTDISQEQRGDIIQYEWHRNDLEIDGGFIPLVYRMATVNDLQANKNYNQEYPNHRQHRRPFQRYSKRSQKNRNGVNKKYSYKHLEDYDTPQLKQYFDFDPTHVETQKDEEELYVDDLRDILPQNKQNGGTQQQQQSKSNQDNENQNIFSAFDQIYNNPDEPHYLDKQNRKQLRKAINSSKNLSKRSKHQLVKQLAQTDKINNEPKKFVEKINDLKSKEGYKNSIDEGLQQVEFDIDMRDMD